MRWLFLFVLSLNFAYLAWHTTRPVTQLYENVQPLKNVRPITLLSEVKQQAQVMAAVQPSLQNDDVKKQQQGPARPQANSEKQQLSPELVEVAEVAAASAKKPEEIKLSALTSAKDKEVAVIEPLKSPNKLQEIPLHKKGGCFTLGPFRDLDKLRSLTRDIKSYVVTTDFRGREERQQYLYWVYIQPGKNHKKAVETGKRLKAKKIKDYYVIREGEKIHGVSLGRFKNKNSANGLAKKAKKLGFDVVVEPVFKTYTVYWLDYQLADGVVIPDTLIEQYTKSTKKDKVSRLSRSCGT